VAEGIFDGVLREGDEEAEVQASATLAAANDFAVQEALKRSGNDPGVARKTEIAILVGIAVMLRDAFTSRSVVIEPFESPPALAVRGMTGKVVASGLLDKLRYFQSVNVAARSSDRELRNAWSGEVQVAIPEVGISVGEVSRLLKARLGHDLHISGELVQDSKDALALTVRGDGVAAKTFVDGADALDKLTAAAADYVYGQAQPAQWTMYLATAGRNDEAIDFARAAFWRSNKADRPRLLVGWAVALTNVGRPREAMALARQAIALDAQLFDARYILMYAMAILGDEEGVLRAGEDMRQAAGGRPGRAAEGYYRHSDLLTFNLQAIAAPWLRTSTPGEAWGGFTQVTPTFSR